MQVRRCAVVWLEPREVASFQLDDLLAGGTGVVARLCWFAHAPHLGAAVEVDADWVPLLGALGAQDWLQRDVLDARHGGAAVDALLAAGLLQAKPESAADIDAAATDAVYRAQGWYPAAAVAHMATRWQGIDGPSSMAEQDLDSNEGLLRQHGAPPPREPEAVGTDAVLHMPVPVRDDFDTLLDRRATCRNFDTEAVLPLATFSQLMARVFGARGSGHPAPDFTVFKRTSPSGGALHPTECFLIVQRVQGIAPGLYRYRIDGHALEPVAAQIAPPQPGDVGTQVLGTAAARAWTQDELYAFAKIAVAGQDFFANAPVLCILAPRFHRNFWKYRNHAKAYRVCVLDVGHLSQTLQLCATQAGLGPFVTGAINEIDIERAFGMASYMQSPLAVCGFGARAATLVKSEFDPNRLVWPRTHI
ncbi:MAG TPA: putative peptide maturation dehydrogenase [Thermomonas sp.]|nr:putative peptide maturation dehydrogenase [Thermomonas sp.]